MIRKFPFLDNYEEKIARSKDALRAFWKQEQRERIPTTVYLPGYYSIEKGMICSLGKYYSDKDANMAAQRESIESHLRILDDDYLPHFDTFFGTPVIASAFGGNVQYFDDKDPWIEGPVIHSPREIDRLKCPDPKKVGLTSRILNSIEYWKSQIDERLPMSMTDIQGPLSVAIDLMGASAFYMALYDEPKRVKVLLEMISEVLIRFLRMMLALIEGNEGIHEWTGIFYPPGCGKFRLSEDNLISISPEMYREFIHPYNELIFGEIGGGILHWCGDGSNNFENALSTKGLTGVHNSTMGDMDLILRQVETIERNNAASDRKLVYFSSMILPTRKDKVRQLLNGLKGKRGVLNFIFYTLDDFGVSFGTREERGYRKMVDDPRDVLNAFLQRE
jgi:hypothetical protein